VALRTAATRAGIPVSVSVEVEAGSSWPPEVSAAVYWCCLEALEHAGAQATVTVREQEGTLAFEVVQDGDRSDAGLERLSDRVQALGGRLTIGSETGRGTRVAGSLSLSR
jgi:signal transduction histidine kinase